MNKNPATVSVVIPVYNEEAYLEACLKSVVAQTDKADEIIVVDNNSTDRSRAIAMQFPVKIIHEKEQGIIYARNRGFNAAQYDLILRIDADTCLPKNWIKRIKVSFKDPELFALSGPARFYDVTPRLVKISGLPITIFLKTLSESLGHDFLWGVNTALRKTAWEKVKDEVCIDKILHEDIDLSIHIAKYGKIQFNPRLIVSCSVRRWKRIASYFDYPYRSFKTIRSHKQYDWEGKSKLVVKKIIKEKLLRYLHHIAAD